MILKLTSTDLLNTSLLDVASGKCAYNIVTALCSDLETDAFDKPTVSSYRTSESSESSSSNASNAPPFSPLNEFNFPSDPPISEPTEHRITQISDGEGEVVAHISWRGRHPDIFICGAKVGGLTNLFGSTTVPFMHVFRLTGFAESLTAMVLAGLRPLPYPRGLMLIGYG